MYKKKQKQKTGCVLLCVYTTGVKRLRLDIDMLTHMYRQGCTFNNTGFSQKPRRSLQSSTEDEETRSRYYSNTNKKVGMSYNKRKPASVWMMVNPVFP